MLSGADLDTSDDSWSNSSFESDVEIEDDPCEGVLDHFLDHFVICSSSSNVFPRRRWIAAMYASDSSTKRYISFLYRAFDYPG